MTDTTNHAEVIRDYLEKIRRYRPDDEMPDPSGIPGLKRMAYSLAAENALTALDALTREAEEAKATGTRLMAEIQADLETIPGRFRVEVMREGPAASLAVSLANLIASHTAQSAHIATLEEALVDCRRELRATNRQLLEKGFNEGMTVTDALAKADTALAPKEAQG